MAAEHRGRRYVVTGAGSGIGRAVTELLISHAADVMVADLDLSSAQTVCDQLSGGPGRAFAVHLDVSDRGAWEQVLAGAMERWGGLDGLVNNAGITRDRSLQRMTDDEWRQVIDVHLRGSWLGCQLAAPHLRGGDDAAIVNISSSGRHGSFGQSNYAAAKAGIVGLTKTVALELARHGIRCNAVAPGAVDTPMLHDVPESVREGWLSSIALGRLARPEEIAEAVAFLLSPAASYITGVQQTPAHVLDVTGGESHL